jgi:signal transduction histidine kinase
VTVDVILEDGQRAALLAEAAHAVAWSTDPVDAVRRVAELAVPRLADWCAVDVLDGDSAYRRVAVVHGDPRRRPSLERLLGRWIPDPRQPGVAEVLRTGERRVATGITDPTVLVVRAHAELERVVGELGVTGYVSVPMQVETRPLGALTLVSTQPGRRFADADVALAETLARMAALALARVRYRDELAAVSERQESVLAVISHELRTPLTAMLAWLQLLHERADAAERAHALEIIERNGRLLGRLIDDLMDTSTIVMGKLHVERQPVDLGAVVRRAADDLAVGAHERDVRLDVEVDPGVAPYDGDRRRLTQIVGALVSNALKFTPPGGRVLVTLDGDAAHVRLRVCDTGRGIAADLLPHVFDVFRRDDRAPGLGLGLAKVRGLVALHGGSVEASSEGPDCGATFTVRLPRH